MMPADPDDPRKFIFRVITKSHPWGYQRTDNTKTLAANNIRKALELYPCEDYLKTDLVQFFPYDAILPLPFSWFIEAIETGQGLDFLLTKFNTKPTRIGLKNMPHGKKKPKTIIKNNFML
ncbi:MAG: hypothetical protein IPO07_08745 [Haliscomenobacter sp.]|nr:hypothetical protein [Haliscomenobacter sp.]MBK9488865.1 hypothetical protein [Haliscomenobacter sp.]